MNRKKDPELYESIPPRRPVVENLCDVFSNIRADEAEHAQTMKILQREIMLQKKLKGIAEDNKDGHHQHLDHRHGRH
eukprot:scaffold1160_cov174-Ochromonas_danica.AAC.28